MSYPHIYLIVVGALSPPDLAAITKDSHHFMTLGDNSSYSNSAYNLSLHIPTKCSTNYENELSLVDFECPYFFRKLSIIVESYVIPFSSPDTITRELVEIYGSDPQNNSITQKKKKLGSRTFVNIKVTSENQENDIVEWYVIGYPLRFTMVAIYAIYPSSIKKPSEKMLERVVTTLKLL